MQLITRVLIISGSLAVLLLMANTARAEDELLAKLPRVTNREAHAHIVAGNAYYRTKEFEKALGEYKKGLQQEDAAIFLYNIGQCHRFLHRWEDAIWVYRRFLDRAKPEPALVERVEGFIKDAEDKNQAEEDVRATMRERADPASAGEPRTVDGQGRPPASPPAKPAPPPTRSTFPVPGEHWYADGVGWGLVGGGIVGLAWPAWRREPCTAHRCARRRGPA